ncbi:hypothetical protein [Ereboglobus luteus]|uniref:DUF3277 domain-containing protein n=1 Tax=Ereboglobus luteus TaxID=1796921 RepID=A0A2U8E6Y8_9BACT|nr:hypothetical protein [Ereboglobus luteus]AWI10312.1 hypothetical protein CKA38_14560 [Ereboglobus luteus]
MANIILTGNDTVKINGRIITAFVTGGKTGAGTIEFPNQLVSITTGKNGNSTYTLNEDGQQCKVVLNLVRGSPDDCFLNSLLSLMKADFASFTLLTGEINKRVGSGDSSVRDDIYILTGGVFTKEVEAKEEDGAATWNLSFNSAPRSIV